MRGAPASVLPFDETHATAESLASAEVSSWLCDVPPPVVAGLQRQHSDDAREGGNDAREGGNDAREGGNDAREGGNDAREGGSSEGGWNSTSSVNGAEQRQPSGESASTRLLAEIKGMRVRESVLREVIERNGGGRKGFEALVASIIVWLKAKFRSASQSSVAGRLRPHSSAEGHGFVDPEPTAGTCASALAVDASSGNLDEAFARDLQCGAVLNWDDLGGESCLSTDELTSGDPSHGWVPETWCSSLVDSAVNCWSFPPEESSKKDEDGVGVGSVRVGVNSTDEVVPSLTEERCHTPPPSRDGGCISAFGEIPAHGSIADATSAVPVAVISGTPGSSGTMDMSPYAPGGPLDLNFACPLPMDPISLEFASSFDLNGPILIGEYLSVPPVGCSALTDGVGHMTGPSGIETEGSSHWDRNKPSSDCRSEPSFESKGDPAVAMRAARKMRMDRNRKATAASSQSKRANCQIVAADTNDGAWNPNALRVSRRSRDASASASASDERPTKKWKGHRDQGYLQFVLQKMLTASDVGNLGRIVLPKKDAEERLPWLDTGDKMQLECEDYDTARKMTLGFRFWLNNGSRMYLIERIGGFVTDHHLRETDRMILYKNFRRGNYLIQAVKARDCTDHFLRTVQSQKPNCNGSEFSEKDSGLDASKDGKVSVQTSAPMLKSSATCGQEPAALLDATVLVASDVFSKKEDSQLNVVSATIMED